MTGETYHLISIGIVILFFYAMSLLMVHYQIISKQKNRKFWNTLLLFFFSSSALLGLFLVVKVNYKLDFPWIEEVMQWHVDCGIGFALVALFHFLWNRKYYFRRKEQSSLKTPVPWASMEGIHEQEFTLLEERTFFLLLGYISIIAQLVLLREFVKNFYGNELVIGIFLTVWMVLSALGVQAGNNYQKALKPVILFRVMILLGLIPLLVQILLILLNRFFFLPGYQAGVLNTSLIILLLTALFTGISGFLFGYVSKHQRSQSPRSSSYRLDALGSLAGGMIFSLVLVHLFNNLQQLALLFLSTCLLIIWMYKYPKRPGLKWILLLLGTVLFTLSLIPGVSNSIEGLSYRQEKILQSKDTPHGNLTFTDRNEQITAYLDGNPVLSSADVMRAEESVHYASLQHPHPASFLLLGGGFAGQINEVAKYQPDRIDYCEADPWIYRLGRIYFPSDPDENLNFIPKDGRTWLMKAGDRQYDIIISTASDPVTVGWNRYFTLEFYHLIKKHLAPGGIFCMQLSTGGNYVNNEGSQVLSINYNTLLSVFSQVVVVPGISTYFIASEAPVSLDFPGLLKQHEISTVYVHPDYMDGNQIRFDSDQLTSRILSEEHIINRDLRPKLFFASLTGLESRMGQHALLITGILISLMFVLLWVLYKPVRTAMYISGFTGAGIQMVLIMMMQSFYGFAYLIAPMMITLFMGGLVLGTVCWKSVWKESSVSRLSGLAVLMALLASICYLLLKAEAFLMSGLPGQLMLGFLNLITGAMVGAVFAMAVNLKGKTSSFSPGILYSADLTGAALGSLLPVVFLLPLIGVANTFILFFAINLVTAIRLMIHGKSHTKDG